MLQLAVLYLSLNYISVAISIAVIIVAMLMIIKNKNKMTITLRTYIFANINFCNIKYCRIYFCKFETKLEKFMSQKGLTSYVISKISVVKIFKMHQFEKMSISMD